MKNLILLLILVCLSSCRKQQVVKIPSTGEKVCISAIDTLYKKGETVQLIYDHSNAQWSLSENWSVELKDTAMQFFTYRKGIIQ